MRAAARCCRWPLLSVTDGRRRAPFRAWQRGHGFGICIGGVVVVYLIAWCVLCWRLSSSTVATSGVVRLSSGIGRWISPPERWRIASLLTRESSTLAFEIEFNASSAELKSDNCDESVVMTVTPVRKETDVGGASSLAGQPRKQGRSV